MLLCFLAISPLAAQSNAPLEAATNAAAYAESLQKPNPDKDLERTRMDFVTDIEKTRLDNEKQTERAKMDNEKELARAKMDNEKELESAKLDNDKQVAINRTDSGKMMVHDLAWNSWVLFAISIFFFGYLKDKRRHDTIRLMIEKGTPITPEVLDGLRKKPRLGARAYDPQGYLCWGVTEVLVAGGLMIAFPYVAGARAAAWIVLAVGVANLILWLIDRAHSNGRQTK